MKGKILFVLFCLALVAAIPASARTRDFYAGAFASPRSSDSIVLEKEVSVPAAGQTTTGQHNVVLKWTDSLNPTGVTYTVKRTNGLCTGTPVFSTLATGLTALTYTDATVAPGNYCYEVTATVAGIESSPSNTVNPTVPSFPPQTLSFTVQ